MVPLSDAGTYSSSKRLATGLMQPALIMLLATHGAPVLSVNGAFVSGFTGFLNGVLSALKFPNRCALVGTVV
jgi:hypothetical protein